MPPLVEVRNLHYRYEGPGASQTEALRGINFTLHPGETVVLLGANGSGKTTFLLHLNGLLRGQGHIEICGLPLEDATLPAIRSKAGLVFQSPDDQLFLPTVLEDVCFGLLNQGITPAEATRRALDTLTGLRLDALAQRAPHQLSEGEKRRVALAGVLVMEPQILLLDEPTTALDPPSHRDLVRLLRALPQAKVIATHDTPFALSLATRAIFFHDGQIIDNGPVPGVLRRQNWEI
jgi:cobalt/nickel transport system ATP-binding protein